MSVYKRKDGVWVIQVQIEGKRHICYSIPKSNKSFRKREEAIAYQPIFIANLIGNGKRGKLIIDDSFIQDFYGYIKIKLKPSTYYGYVNTFDKYWKPLVIGLDVMGIDNNKLETIANRLFSRKHNWNGKAASGKWFVKYLKRSNPMLDPDIISAPKLCKPKIHEYHIYSEEESAKFMSVIKDDEDRFLFLLLFNYGLRISECLAIQWNDFKADGLHIDRSACVKNDSHKVLFTTPKTANSIRVYPLLDVLKPYIEELKPNLPRKGFVFKSVGEAPIMGQSSVRRKSVLYANAAEVKVIKLHEFRHSCVSNLLMHGMPPRIVAKWVGDTESMVLNTYSHLLPNEKDTIADFINTVRYQDK